MSVARKHIPEPVVWDQTSILREIAKLTSQISVFETPTGNPGFDTRGVAVREVRKSTELLLLEEMLGQLRLIVLHLSLLTEVDLKIGDN